MRFRVSVVVAALVLTGCNANRAINPSSQPPPRSLPATTWTTILTIPSATHRTTPGAAVVVKRRGWLLRLTDRPCNPPLGGDAVPLDDPLAWLAVSGRDLLAHATIGRGGPMEG